MIDVNQVRELIELMIEHELSEIRVREGDTAISLRKGPAGFELTAAPQPVAAAPPSVPAAAPAVPAPAAEPSEEEGIEYIRSPMVGTFYTASDPDSPPFVEVGSEVNADSPVCIIEAMKVFNEIQAELSGTVTRILVQNQQAVEFGQPLMAVRLRH